MSFVSVERISIPHFRTSKHSSGIATPPLKWAGGKRWQLPYLKPLYARHSQSRLIEPFAGGLAVSLGLQPNLALVNDINEHLINFYRWIRKGLIIEFEMRNEETTFYQYREHFNELIHSGEYETAEAAGLFYYLNRTGFNGLCRFNQSGGFNVPFGRYATLNYTCDFTPYRKIFHKWAFRCSDFSDLKLKANDFIYADPPYDVEFTQYSKEGFSWDDQIRLAEWLATHPGPVVLSNQATSRVKKLYKDMGFSLHFLNAPRLISCNGDRTPAREVIATKNI